LEIGILRELYQNHPQLLAGKSVLSKTGENLYLEGLIGSSISLALAALFESGKRDFVLVHEDAELAGYLYHDLVQLLGSEKVFYYPASFKRALKYGRNDPGNTILRTEALTALRQEESIVVVTYPDALLEKVVSTEELKQNTLTLHKGEHIDNAFVIELLQTFGFERVDYVYEPGQFAVRGSLIDVYSWSHELPYRIDFFGDEVESIRSFDIENQLSNEHADSIKIVPFADQGSQNQVAFTDYLNADALLGFSDFDYACGKLRILAEEPGDTPLDRLLTDTDFQHAAQKHSWVEFGRKAYSNKHTTLNFQTSPQDQFGKNFDFVSQAFQRYTELGYQLFVLSDSPKQIERLKQSSRTARNINISIPSRKPCTKDSWTMTCI